MLLQGGVLLLFSTSSVASGRQLPLKGKPGCSRITAFPLRGRWLSAAKSDEVKARAAYSPSMAAPMMPASGPSLASSMRA